jgi:Na+-driven multidrug efflux pump
MMVLKCITIYLIIGWIFEGICFLVFGGIEKYFDEIFDTLGGKEKYSQKVIDFATKFTIIVMSFIWPYLIGYVIYYCVKKSRHK